MRNSSSSLTLVAATCSVLAFFVMVSMFFPQQAFAEDEEIIPSKVSSDELIYRVVGVVSEGGERQIKCQYWDFGKVRFSEQFSLLPMDASPEAFKGQLILRPLQDRELVWVPLNKNNSEYALNRLLKLKPRSGGIGIQIVPSAIATAYARKQLAEWSGKR